MKYEIKSIKGDASFRKFYRITLNKKSKIIVKAAKDKYKNLIVYSAINHFLKNNKVKTPRLFSHNYKKGIIIIEDFGDLSFYKILIKQKNKIKTYKKLIDLLLKIQKIKPKLKIKTITNNWYYINSYSYGHLHKESDLFFDWYLPLFFNNKKVVNLKRKARKILSRIYKKINFTNYCFVHRDYHAQNLMKVGNEIGVIDSQDALIGNPAYDLVSLIDDVRIKTSKKLKDQVYNYYLKKNPKFYGVNSKKFLQDFNILSIQRNLKIIGIFCRLFKRDEKKKYLRFIPYTWKLLEARLDSEIFYDLKKFLDKTISIKMRKKKVFK